MARVMGDDTMAMTPQNAVPDYLKQMMFQHFDDGGQVQNFLEMARKAAGDLGSDVPDEALLQHALNVGMMPIQDKRGSFTTGLQDYQKNILDSKHEIAGDAMRNIPSALYGAARGYATAPIRWGLGMGNLAAEYGGKAYGKMTGHTPSYVDLLPAGEDLDMMVDEAIPGSLSRENRPYQMGRTAGDAAKIGMTLGAVSKGKIIKRLLSKAVRSLGAAAGVGEVMGGVDE